MIKYDEALNAEIRRVVKNFNQKRNRAYKRGFSYLPDKQFVSTIKAHFDNKPELRRYLKELEKFNKLKDSALETVETFGGGRTSRWNLMFIKDNLEETKAFFDRQIKEAYQLFYEDEYSIARRDYLFNLEQKRKYLDINIMNLDQSGIKTMEKYTHQMLDYNKSNITAYKGFLSGLEQIMKQIGYDEKSISRLYEKMANISPAQFVKMYRNSDLIARIYDIIPSPDHGKGIITTDEEGAKNYINKFMDTFEEEMKRSNKLSEFSQEVDKSYEEFQKSLQQATPTLKKSDLTPQQLKQLRELGWMDLVDEDA